MNALELKRANPREIDVVSLHDKKFLGKLLLEQTIKSPGDILMFDEKSYITVEKSNHYYFDGFKYQFAKTVLYVKPLEDFH